MINKLEKSVKEKGYMDSDEIKEFNAIVIGCATTKIIHDFIEENIIKKDVAREKGLMITAITENGEEDLFRVEYVQDISSGAYLMYTEQLAMNINNLLSCTDLEYEEIADMIFNECLSVLGISEDNEMIIIGGLL